MNADAILMPTVAVLSMVYAGLSTVKATTTVFAPAIEGHAQAPVSVRPGDVIPVTWTVTRRTDCPAEAANIWVGQSDFLLAEATHKGRWPLARAPIVAVVPTMVPALAPEGLLTLTIEGSYTCPGQPSVNYSLGPVEMMVVRDGK
jgi:hypothetical protein